MAAASFLVQRNSVPSTHMRCMMTANRRATATIARFMPRWRAIFMPQALSHDHLRLWVIRTRAASNNVSRIRACPHFEMPPIRSISPDCCRHSVRPGRHRPPKGAFSLCGLAVPFSFVPSLLAVAVFFVSLVLVLYYNYGTTDARKDRYISSKR
jgi:hypothetical protein